MGIFSFLKKNKKGYYDEETDDILMEEEVSSEGEEKQVYNYDFKLQDKKESIRVEESTFQRVSLTEEELDALIVEQVLMVISNHKNFEDIEKISAKAAANIGKEYVEKLSEYIEGKISKPSYMKERFDGLGQWSMVVENAVLTIIYSFKKYGVDELLKIAVGSKNTKFKAINLLCKLANEGIEKEKIVDSIIFIMREHKEADVIKILSYISQIKNYSKIEKLINLYFKKYILENRINEAYDMVINLLNVRGFLTKRELTFIKSMALVEGKLPISLIIENEIGNIDLSKLEEEMRIQAAITFYNINKEDKEISDKLHYLKDNSLNSELRKYLSELLIKSK